MIYYFSGKKREWIVLGDRLWACSDARLVEEVTFCFHSKASKAGENGLFRTISV